jgi:cell division protein FtsL
VDTYITLLAIFTGLLALAIVAQAVVIVLAYLRVAKLDEETKALRKQVQEQTGPILRNVEDLSANVRDRSHVIL